MRGRIATYLEMIKFSHTVFALPFALAAAALAAKREGGLRPIDLFAILACMVFARSAAMGFNRWADRLLDAANPRTQGRALPAGLLSPTQVLGFTVASGVGFIGSTALFVLSSGNWIPLLASGPVLAWLLGYSYAKRFTSLAHVWLGIALGLAPLGAWAALRPVWEAPPLLLGLAVVCWVTGFDILYACQDIETDRKQGLHSVPAALGFAGALWVSRLAHAAMLVALVGFGLVTPELGVFFWGGLVFIALLLLVEHYLARWRDLARINIAFFHVNSVLSLGLLALLLADLYG